MKKSRCASVTRGRRPTGAGIGGRTDPQPPPAATTRSTPTRDHLASAVWQASLAAEILGDAHEALFAFRHPRERMQRAVRLLGSLTLPAGHRVEHAMREFSLAFADDCPAWAIEQVTRIRSFMERMHADVGWQACAAALSCEELSELADAFFELYDLVCQAER